MSEIVTRLRERRAAVWEQAKGLADKAAEENRAFSGEEESQWQTLNAELDALDKRIKAVLDGETRAKDTEESFQRLVGKPVERAASQSGDGGDVAKELRSWLRGESRSRFYEVRPTSPGPISYRALSKLTTGAGGNTVPTSFYDRLMAHLVEVSAILQAGATVLRTDSGEQLQVPKTTGHSTAVLTAEAASLSASDPAFGQATLGAYKYGVLIQVSRELIDDTGVDLEGYLAMQAGRALGNAFGADAITGNGSAKPTGILNNSTLGVTGPTGANGGLGATSATANQGGDLLYDLFYSVIAPYRASQSCAWIVRDATMAVLRKIKDTTGQYIFQPSMVAGTPDTLVGKPIYTDPFVPAIATGAKSIIFGDLSQFFVRIAGGVRFERSDEYAFANDLVTFRALLRADSVLVDQTGAVKHFAGNAAV
ncbi:MAG TPA: phage major capsid protein [Jiangellaceae bacterium]|nr:phage major capsid protein [Jiangellaceae bacterium]